MNIRGRPREDTFTINIINVFQRSNGAPIQKLAFLRQLIRLAIQYTNTIEIRQRLQAAFDQVISPSTTDYKAIIRRDKDYFYEFFIALRALSAKNNIRLKIAGNNDNGWKFFVESLLALLEYDFETYETDGLIAT